MTEKKKEVKFINPFEEDKNGETVFGGKREGICSYLFCEKIRNILEEKFPDWKERLINTNYDLGEEEKEITPEELEKWKNNYEMISKTVKEEILKDVEKEIKYLFDECLMSSF